MRSEKVTTEDFVAGGDVVDGKARERIADNRKDTVQDVSPVALNAMRSAVKAVAENSVGMAFEDGSEEQEIVAGIVFEIGVLNEDDFAGGLREACTNACAFALVLVVKRQFDGGLTGSAERSLQVGLLEEFAGAVGRAVIHNNEFFA